MHDNEDIKKFTHLLLDHKIIYTVKRSFSHKFHPGVTFFRAFMINSGLHSDLQNLHDRIQEIDLAASDAGEKIRSAPILTEKKIMELWSIVPKT